MNRRTNSPILFSALLLIPSMLLLVTSGLAFQTQTSPSRPPSRIGLMETGEFHGNEITAGTGQSWLGLYCVGNEHSLRFSRVTIETVTDVVVDEDESQKTGKSVSVDGADKPVFLIKGAVTLTPGRVKTAYVGEILLTNTTDLKLKLGEEIYRLKVETRDRSAIDAVTSDDARLVLIHRAERQVLYGLGGKGAVTEANWSLLWAGDLDGDHKMDLYVNASDHYNVSERRLFLSSPATKRKMLKQVAVFRTVGC